MTGSQAHMVHGLPARAEVKLPPVAKAQAALDECLARCPGNHAECYGKPAMEKARLRWIYEKDHLKAMLEMAKEAERSGWRDAKGKPVEHPITWAKPKETTAKAEEMRRYRERKAKGEVGISGRRKVA